MRVGHGAKGTKVWSQWGSWRLTPWRTVTSWFPRFDVSNIGTAFRSFYQRWNTRLWHEPLRHAAHWYVEANTGAGAFEGGLILSQAALEMLSWVYVVEDKRIVWNKTFDGYRAARKIRKLLRELSIPTVVPTECRKLQARFPGDDGPTVITTLRNAVVHGKASKRRVISQTARQARFEALHLALGYVELAILGIIGYKGQYQRRLTRGTAFEATTKVPWA